MMIAFVRKNLTFFILKHTSPPCNKSPVSLSLPLHFFSTWSEGKLGFSHSLVDILRHKYDFPPEISLRVALELTRVKTPEKADLILSFLKESGFSNTQLEKIVKYKSRILVVSLEDSIKPKFKIFQDLGFSSGDITKLITANPSILHLSTNNNIIPSLSVLKNLLGSNNEVIRFIRKSTWSLTVNLENTLLPNLEFLNSSGISMERIRIVLNVFPSVFLLKRDVLSKSIDKAKEMGLDGTSKTFIYAIPTLASISNEAWELKLQAFRDLGFSDTDILAMFRKAPHAFSGSMEKIKKIKELLLATGKFNMSCIVNYPKSLASSIENRYTPRLRILGILESRNLISNWPSLTALSMLPDDEFYKKFVSRHLDEVSDVYCTKSSTLGKMEEKPKAYVKSTKMEYMSVGKNL